VLHEDGRLPELDLTAGQARLLDHYEELLSTKAVPLGLVAGRDRARIRERHIADSLRAVPLIKEQDRRGIDLGSGAGLPGIVVAVAVPSLTVVLLESRRKRVAFLEWVLGELGLRNAEVLHGRAEDLEESVDVCLARAFAPLRRSWAAGAPLLRSGGRLIYFAGASGEVPSELPFATNVQVGNGGVVESGGPLVIITRE
jgi:16S rRNA (guanine527-N7)-methyltransferase